MFLCFDFQIIFYIRVRQRCHEKAEICRQGLFLTSTLNDAPQIKRRFSTNELHLVQNWCFARWLSEWTWGVASSHRQTSSRWVNRRKAKLRSNTKETRRRRLHPSTINHLVQINYKLVFSQRNWTPCRFAREFDAHHTKLIIPSCRLKERCWQGWNWRG